MADFTGFPSTALDFYDDLEVDNTRTFWEKHKGTYDYSVKQPMTALCAALAEEFGEAKIFRPFRDVRFAKDKTEFDAFMAERRNRPAPESPSTQN